MLKMGQFGVVRGHPRSLKIAPCDRAYMSSYQLSIVTVSLSCTVSEIQRDIGRKAPLGTYPTSIWRPRWGDVAGILHFWHRKTRVSGLSYGIVSLIIGLAIFVQLRLVTDRQTDRQTDGQTDRHTMTANTALAERRAVKKSMQLFL